ncbi:MAG: hypothetical protein ACO4AI_07945 [Prochlorothrix sp.]
MDDRTIQDILALRSKNLTPKQIARKLGLKPAEISAILKDQGSSFKTSSPRLSPQAPLYGCWINSDFRRKFVPANQLKPIQAGQLQPGFPNRTITRFFQKKSSELGLATVAVARHSTESRLKLGFYLVDYYCLGVKSVMPIRTIEKSSLTETLAAIYRLYDFGHHQVSLPEAQALVFGAIEFAERCGFRPHRSFDSAARNMLGEWDRSIGVECGYGGQPFYQQGPSESPARVREILATLEQTVGAGNFQSLTLL